MEDQLVSFKTAKLAKKKGFNWDTLFYYDSKGDGVIEAAYYESTPNNAKGDLWFSGAVFECTAPTQSLLQRWLREQNIIVEIIYDNTMWYYKIFVTLKEEDFYVSMANKSYEDALEKALQHTLTNFF